jgi:hypothetical protein
VLGPAGRLPTGSPTLEHSGGIQQADRRVQRRRTEVHVPLRHGQLSMSSQVLNCACGSTPHRQMRTERVPQDVDAIVDVCTPCGPLHAVLHLLPCEAATIGLAEDAGAA